MPWPAQGLYTNGEVPNAEAMVGMRMRAYNAALEEFSALVKAAPVQVEAADIPQAFATGQVQAMITSPSTGANSSAWDYVDTYTAIDAWLPKNIVVVNKNMFDALSPEVQQVVLDASAAAEIRGIEMSKAETTEKVAVMAENGMTIAAPSEELVAELQAVGAQMLDNWKANASDPALAILTAFEAR